MPFSSTISAYPDVRKLFDRALESAKGLSLTFETENEATYNAGRFNAFRRRDREENAKIYPADHVLHGASPYDNLMIKRKGIKVEIVKLDVANFNVEEIGDAPGE